MEANFQGLNNTAVINEASQASRTGFSNRSERLTRSENPAPRETPEVRDTRIVNEPIAEPVLTGSVPFSDQSVTDAYVERALQAINQVLAPSHFSLSHDIHEDTNMVMVRIVDTDTNEIIRELPPESRLDLIARMQEFAGLLFDATT